MSQNVWDKTNQKLIKTAGNVNLDDSVISEESAWSSKKINDSLVDLNTFEIYSELESFIDASKNNVKYFGVNKNGTDYGGPLSRMAFGKVQVQLASNGVVRCIQTLDYSTEDEGTAIYSRTGVYSNGSWTWGDWQDPTTNFIKTGEVHIATKDFVNGMHLTNMIAIPDGYKFLCWYNITSDGFVMNKPIYISNPSMVRGCPYTDESTIPREDDKFITCYYLMVRA